MRRVLAGFEVSNLRFEGVELVAGAGQQFALQIELLARDQFETLEGLREQGLQIALQICCGPGAQQPQYAMLQIVEKRLSIHGESSLA